MIGVPWYEDEAEWNAKHAFVVESRPALEHDTVLRQAEEKYVLKYKTEKLENDVSSGGLTDEELKLLNQVMVPPVQ